MTAGAERLGTIYRSHGGVVTLLDLARNGALIPTRPADRAMWAAYRAASSQVLDDPISVPVPWTPPSDLREPESLPGRMWMACGEWFDACGFLLCPTCLRRAGGPLDGCDRRDESDRVRSYRLQLEAVTGGRDVTAAEIVRDVNARLAVAR